MKSLKKIVGELVLAMVSGAAVGAAVGHTVEACRKESYNDEREKNSALSASKYETNRRFIYGTGVLGGILGFAIYVLRGKDDEKEGNEEERQGGQK